MGAYIIVVILLGVLLIWGGYGIYQFFRSVYDEEQHEKNEYEYFKKHYPDYFPKDVEEKK